MHSSRTMAMSEPRASWISAAFAGVRRCSEPSRWERKRTPPSVIFRHCVILKTSEHREEEDEGNPNSEDNANRLAEGQFPWIACGKTDGHKHNGPDSEEVQRRKRHHLPHRQIASEYRGRIGSEEILGIY